MRTLTYLDHAATTPLLPEVAQAMAAVHAEPLGNPTGSHPAGQRARRLLEEARDQVAAVVGCAPADVIFTSGGTESANLAVLGTLGAIQTTAGSRPVVAHSAVEHPAVLESGRAASSQGLAEVHVLGVDRAGVLDLAAFEDWLVATALDGPLLVALMAANNETGVCQPVVAAAELVRQHRRGALVFSDAVQAAPFIDLTSLAATVDLLSLSAHKVGGPVGTGVLVVRPPARVVPLLHGGGQERERRSGTQDVAGAVGLATALGLAAAGRDAAVVRVTGLRDRLADGLVSGLEGVHRTVPSSVATLPGHLHLCLEGIEREELLVALGRHGVCASGGSSCASGALDPSHVLAAMGVPDELARGVVRFSLGASTTEEDVARALVVVPEVVTSLRRAV